MFLSFEINDPNVATMAATAMTDCNPTMDVPTTTFAFWDK
jgi:hypothetical protein